MNTFAYQRGYLAALRRKPHGSCPYTDKDLQSRRWRKEWMAGHYDGWVFRDAEIEAESLKRVQR